MKNLPLSIALLLIATAVLSSVGILILVFQRAAIDIVLGILVLILSISVLTGGILTQVFVRRQARQVQLQTDFVSKVSHELRTPLSSIRMFVDTLQSGTVTDTEQRDMCLDVISTETSRLTSMIERLLEWGRMEAGRRTYDMRPELVGTLIGEALAQVEPQLQGQDVQIDLELTDEDHAVEVDRAAIVETLLNLLVNALKYGASPDGSGTRIVVRVRRHRDKVMVDVVDGGRGIPRKEHRRIFERFYRGTASVDAHTKGSGLGLAMARHAVRAHRGKITVSSAPDEGACFTLTLPALPSPEAALEIPPG